MPDVDLRAAAAMTRKRGHDRDSDGPTECEHSADQASKDGQVGGNAMMSVLTLCSLTGTFKVTVRSDAVVDDLVDAIAESRGIANARRAVAVFVAGDDEPLAATQSVADRMAETGARELFMLVRVCNDRQILEDIYNGNHGAHWDDNDDWLTDAPLDDWHGVTADAADNVTELNFVDNKVIMRLPDSLEGLARLRILALRGTRITGLPAALEGLRSLQKLNIGYTEITAVPSSIGDLKALTLLDIRGTNITGLPQALGQCTRLLKLHL
jgi:hypothetical protein